MVTSNFVSEKNLKQNIKKSNMGGAKKITTFYINSYLAVII